MSNVGRHDYGGQPRRTANIEMAAHDQLPPLIRHACNHTPRLVSSPEILSSWIRHRNAGKTEIEFLAKLHNASLRKCGRSFFARLVEL